MQQRIDLAAALAALLLALPICMAPAAAQAPACATGVVRAPAGPTCGTLEATSSGKPAWAFRGIPYAESTAGEKRWTRPVPKARWMQTFAAVRYGAICPQTPKSPRQEVATPATPRTSQTRKLFNTAAKSTAAAAATVPTPPTEDEDCLSLNIWTPAGVAPNAGLPVMVFIHGGSFVAGSGADPMYDGAYLAANQDVLLVTINYRLGVLGFLAADGLSGNYGILDQQAALTWVRENIRSFGGDPGKVTIFGESAGAMSVGLHVFSAPVSQPLFRAAIMESNFFSLPYKRLADQANVGSIFKQGMNCRDIACLRRMPANDIVTQQYAYTNEMSTVFSGTQYYIPFAPTVDGTVLTRQPVAGAAIDPRKPILLGTNKDEALLFTEGRSFPPLVYAADVAELIGLPFQSVIAKYPASDTGTNELVWGQVETEYFLICSTRHVAASVKSPTYAYLFNHQPSFKVWGSSTCRTKDYVCHGDELPFVFHTADKIGGQFTADEEKLSETMGRSWSNFATHLDPNGAAASAPATRWPKFSAQNRSYLTLNTPAVSVQNDPYRETCTFWDRIGYELFNPWAPKPQPR
jgi:carboxylesterase type B